MYVYRERERYKSYIIICPGRRWAAGHRAVERRGRGARARDAAGWRRWAGAGRAPRRGRWSDEPRLRRNGVNAYRVAVKELP